MNIEVIQKTGAVKKLIEARVKFQGTGAKMSGKNSFANYSYFELADILPLINKIGQEIGFACIVSFTDDLATLDFVDSETGESIQFTSPMSTAKLKGCHDVQNMGAVQTYLKRYLYQNAFEIVESDALNGTQGTTEKKGGYDADYYKNKLLDMPEVQADKVKLDYVKGLKSVNKFTYEKITAKIYAEEQQSGNLTKEFDK